MGYNNGSYCSGCLATAYNSIQKLLCDIETLPPNVPIYLRQDPPDGDTCDCCSFCKTVSSKKSVKASIDSLVENFYSVTSGLTSTSRTVSDEDVKYAQEYYTIFQYFNSSTFEVNCCGGQDADLCPTITAEDILSQYSDGAGGYIVVGDPAPSEEEAENNAQLIVNTIFNNLDCSPKLRLTIIGHDGTVVFDSLYFKRCISTVTIQGDPTTYKTTIKLIPAPCSVNDFRGVLPAIDQVGPSSCVVDIPPILCPPCEQNQSYPRFNLNTRKEVQFAMNTGNKGYAYRYSPVAYWLKRVWKKTVGPGTDPFNYTDGGSLYFYAFGTSTFGNRCNPFGYTIRFGYQVPYQSVPSGVVGVGCGCK